MEAQVTADEGGLPAGAKLAGFDVVCLSIVDPRALRQAKRLVLRLRTRRAEPARLYLGLWRLPSGELENARAPTGADRVVGTLGQAVEAIRPPPAEAAATDRQPATVSASP